MLKIILLNYDLYVIAFSPTDRTVATPTRTRVMLKANNTRSLINFEVSFDPEGWGGEGERERDTHTHTHTHRKTVRGRKRERGRERKREYERDRHTHRNTERERENTMNSLWLDISYYIKVTYSLEKTIFNFLLRLS